MNPKTLYLERLLQINAATLAALGALLLGMGQRDEKLPLLMLVAAVTSIVLTDVTGYIRLNRAVANLAVLAGVAVFVFRIVRYQADIHVLLPSLGTFLTFCLIVLLFQKKDPRVYRHLIILSLAQVVAAAVFSHGVWFGLLLVVYMTVGFSALVLLLLYTQWTRYRTLEQRLAARHMSGGKLGGWGKAQRCPSSRGQGLRCAQPPATQHFVGMPSGHGQMGVGRQLVVRLGKMALGALLLTAVLFFTLPRFSRSAWRGTTVHTRHVVGFSDKVALGEIGTIIESREEVMRVWLADAKTGQPYQHGSSLYLRGAVLNQYDRGQWEYRSTGRKPIPPVAEADASVRQTIEIEPLDADELFCVWPFSSPDLRVGNTVTVVGRTQRIRRPLQFRHRRFSYELGTTGLSDGVQVELIPSSWFPDIDDFQQLLQLPEGLCGDALESMWSDDGLRRGENPVQLARAITARFHDREQFQYSLEPQPRQSDHDPNVDPVVDFLQNNPRGHCEYFASALALLLRSRNIPARVVVGYNCDEFNEAGGFWQVRQWHAHAWVEAYIWRQDVPERLIAKDGAEHWKHGGWLRLEPTPGMETPAAERDSSFFEPVENVWRRLQDLWSDYIVEMDSHRQHNAIYDPIVRAVKHAFQCLSDPDWWRDLMWYALDALNVAKGGLHWFWAGIALAVGLPVTIYIGRRVGRLLRWFWWRVIRRTRPDDRGGPAGVEFYRRLEVLLARQGITRHPGQTQHEFADAAGAQIARSTGRLRLAPLPGRVAEAFYQVRFSQLPLDNDQAQAVEHALDELAASAE